MALFKRFEGQMVDFTVDVVHELGFIFVKVGMKVDVLIGVFLIGHLLEIVNVELAYERGQVGMFEVFRKDFLRKSRRVFYLKLILLLVPCDVLRGLILLLLKQLHSTFVSTSPERLTP